MNAISQAAQNLKGNWHKGGYNGPNNSHCGLGHVGLVLCGKDITSRFSLFTLTNEVINPDESLNVNEYTGMWKTMTEVANEQYPERTRDPYGVTSGDPSFASFNDHPSTTEDDVIAVMEKAAVRWDERVE